MSKIFCISFQRTGTTSVGQFFKDHGYLVATNPVSRANDWAPTIAHRLGARRYVNPAGGRELFRKEQFDELGVELRFLQHGSFEYPTPGYQFQPNLSILDAMMWNDPTVIRKAVMENVAIVQ